MKKRKFAGLLVLTGLLLTCGVAITSCSENPSGETNQDDDSENNNNNNNENEGGNENKPSEEKTFKVTVEKNDEVNVKTDKAEYKKGETVTLTLEILNADKEVDFIQIGENIEVKEVTKNVTYTFVMPEANVSVKVNLKDRVFEAHALKVNQVEGFEVKFLKDNLEVTEAKKGETVTVKISATSLTKRFVSFTSSDVQLNEVKKGEEYTFVMLDQEVNFVLTVEAIPSRKLAFKGDEGVSGVFKQDDKEITSALEGSEVTLELTVNEEDYYFASIDADGTELKTIEEGKEYSFVVGTSDIEIVVTTALIPTYDLKVNSVEGGQVKFLIGDSEVTKAKEGQNVKVQVLVDEGYRFVSFTSEDVVWTDVDTENLVYTFEMPGKEVNFDLVVEYIPKEYEVLSITELDVTWGDYTLEVGQKIVEGSEVKFTFDAGVNLTYFVDINEETYQAIYNKETGLYEVTFKMPSCDIDVFVYKGTLESEAADAITITYEENKNYKIYGISNGGKYDKNGEVKVRIVPARGVRINKVSYDIDNGTKTGTMYGSSGLYNLSYLNVATAEFKIIIDSEYVGAYDITLTNTEGVEVSGQLNGVLPGTYVSLTVSTSEDYRVASSNSLTYSCDNEEESFRADYSSYNNKITFTMPKGNVTLTLNLIGKRNLSFEEAEHVSNVRFSSEEDDYEYSRIDSAFEGDNVYVFYDIEEGYYVENIEIDGVGSDKINRGPYDEYFRFEMVDQDVVVKFNVVKMITVSYDTEKIEVTGLDDYLIPGEKYTFEVEALKGFRLLGDPELVDSEDNPVEVEKYEDYYGDVEYTFIAPDKDLTLQVKTEAVATPTIHYDFYNLEGYEAGRYSPRINNSNGSVYDGDQVTEGEILTISNFNTSYISYGYELEGIFIIFEDESPEVEIELPAYTSYGIDFEAPGKDFTVEIRIKKLEMASIKYKLPEGVEIDVSVDYKTIKKENETFNVVKGDTAEVTLSLDYSHSDDYYIDLTKLKVTNLAGDNLLTIDETNTKVEEYSFEVTMKEDVNISLSEINEYAKYSISVKEGSQFADSLSIKTDYYSSAIGDTLQREGTELTAYLDDLTSDEFKNNTYTLQIYDENGELINEVEFKAEYVYYSTYYGATFLVPDCNIYLDVVRTPKA